MLLWRRIVFYYEKNFWPLQTLSERVRVRCFVIAKSLEPSEQVGWGSISGICFSIHSPPPLWLMLCVWRERLGVGLWWEPIEKAITK